MNIETRGILPVPTGTLGVDYQEGTGEKNPLTACRGRLHNYGPVPIVGKVFISALGAGQVGAETVNIGTGDPMCYFRIVIGDSIELRIYDNSSNASTGGSTGWLASSMYDIPNSTPGTYLLQGVTSGSLNGSTWGWLYLPDGIDFVTLGNGWVDYISLDSRDFIMHADEMEAGATFELSFAVLVTGLIGDDAPPFSMFAKTAGASLYFLTENSYQPQVYYAANNSNPVILSGRMTIDVLENDGTDVSVRTSVMWDNLYAGGTGNIIANNSYGAVSGEVATFSLASFSSARFLEAGMLAQDERSGVSMKLVRSQLKYCAPAVIE